MIRNVKWMDNQDIYKLAEEGLIKQYDKNNINLIKNYNYIESIDLMEKGYSQTELNNRYQQKEKNINIIKIYKNIKNIKDYLYTFIHKLNKF